MTTLNPTLFQQHIRTTDDTTFLLSLLSQLSTELFKKDRTLEQILEKDISYQQGLNIKKIAIAHEVNLTNTTEVVNFLNQLTQAIHALPIVNLEFAFPPKSPLITMISQWFLVNMQQMVVLKITVNPAIMAGSVISFHGKRKDYSLKQELFGKDLKIGA